MPELNERLVLELEGIAAVELASIDSNMAGLDFDKNLLVMAIVRFVDRMSVDNWLFGTPDDSDAYFAQLLTLYGFVPALGILLPKVVPSFGMLLSPSSDQSIEIANAILNHIGRVKFLRRSLNLAKSGVVKVRQDKKVVRFESTELGSGVEALESAEKQRLIELEAIYFGEPVRRPLQISPELEKMMSDNVYVWREHFIGYDAEPELDRFFLEAAMAQIEEWRVIAGVHPGTKFGRVSGTDLLVVATALTSMQMKHVGFCIEYIRKFPEKDLNNVLTIWEEKQKLIEAISDFVGVPRAIVHKSLNILSLNRRNALTHAQSYTSSLPPLVEVTRRMWIRPVSSTFHNSLQFGSNELKRAHRKAWDKSIRKREGWFRNDLYALFMGNRYQTIALEQQIRDGRTTVTDVDAAIFDREYHTLALFELKWQEPIGDDESKRRSRAKRLGREIRRWTKAIAEFLDKQGIREIARQIGFDERTASLIGSVKLFVIARHNARFSRFDIGNPNVAVASWQQFTRIRLEKGSVDDTFAEVFQTIKQEEVRSVIGEPITVRFPLAGLEIEAEQFTRLSKIEKCEP